MPYDPDCQTESRVFVNGTRLPAGDIDVWLRKEGPLSITRYAEGTFASPRQGEDYLQYFDGIDTDQQDEWDVIRIEMVNPYESGFAGGGSFDPSLATDYITVFAGLVTGVGDDVSGNSKMWSFRAQGLGHYLDKVPAGNNFRGTTTVNDVTTFIEGELEAQYPVPIATTSSSVVVEEAETGEGDYTIIL